MSSTFRSATTRWPPNWRASRRPKSGFVLVADGRVAADFALEVGPFSETVLVTVESETVNTISGEVARTVDRAQVQDLALNGRNYMQLTTLVPGVPLLNTTRWTS